MPLLLILGGVGLLLLLPLVCCGGGVAWFMLAPAGVSMSSSPARVTVSATPVPTTIDRPIPAADKDRPGDGNPVPVQPPNDPPPDKPKDPPPDKPKDPPPVVPWQAQADPTAGGRPAKLPDKPQGVIPITGYPCTSQHHRR